MKIIAFDLDDVLCFRDSIYEHLGPDKYQYCQPIPKNIDLMNQCYHAGYYIKIYTARGMSQFKGDVELTKTSLYQLTQNQLLTWGALYHELIFGKTHYDLLIDDKAHNIADATSLEFIKAKLNEI